MLLNLQKYDLTVEYKPGKGLYIADTLSRAPSPNDWRTEHQNVLHTVEYLPVSNEKLQQFRLETRNDPTLKKLFHTIHTGWPNKNPDAAPSINEYWPVRDEISSHDGLLLRGERLVVPSTMRREML